MVPLRKASYGSNSSDTNIDDTKELEEKILTSTDDEEVKKARRRMKNKISAQESRRRKKEYVDALELKMKQRDQEKKLLTEKVEELEEKVRLLVDELFQAKQSQNDKVSSTIDCRIPQKTTGTQTGICLNCFTHTNPRNDTVRKSGSVSSSTISERQSSFETNIEELDANCHDYRQDSKKMDRFYESALYTPYSYPRYRDERYHDFIDSRYKLEKKSDRRFYYEKPYTRKTASVSPHLLQTSCVSPRITCVSPIRSSSSPLRSTCPSPRNIKINEHIEYPTGSIEEEYSIKNRRYENSLYSQLVEESERRLSPQ